MALTLLNSYGNDGSGCQQTCVQPSAVNPTKGLLIDTALKRKKKRN